jgi:hypothetical protein
MIAVPVAAISPQRNWTGKNTTLAASAAVTLAGGLGVILFGVVLTHGVYGSRMAWLLGVAFPLLAIAAGLAFAAAKLGANSGMAETTRPEYGGQANSRDSRNQVRTVGFVSILLIAIPLALAGVLLASYALLVATHVFH